MTKSENTIHLKFTVHKFYRVTFSIKLNKDTGTFCVLSSS